MLIIQIFCKNSICWLIRGVCALNWSEKTVWTPPRNFTMLDACDSVRFNFKARMCWGKLRNFVLKWLWCRQPWTIRRIKCFDCITSCFGHKTLSEVNVNDYGLYATLLFFLFFFLVVLHFSRLFSVVRWLTFIFNLFKKCLVSFSYMDVVSCLRCLPYITFNSAEDELWRDWLTCPICMRWVKNCFIY